MPSWKKVITSGSDASLNSLYTTGPITGSNLQVNGNIKLGDGSSDATITFTPDAGGAPTLKYDNNVGFTLNSQTDEAFVFSEGGNTPFVVFDGLNTNVLIGTTTPNASYKLVVNGDISAVSASFSGTATAVDFILSSDERMKENIIPLEITPPDIIWKQYNFKDNVRQRYGVIAQDIEKTHPELVSTDKEGMKSVSYIDLLVLKMAEKDKQIEELQKDIELLKMLLSK